LSNLAVRWSSLSYQVEECLVTLQRIESRVLVVNRFRVPVIEASDFRQGLELALATLAAQRGYLGGSIGRNVDDPELWVLQTTWESPGAYRRALSAYDVKVQAWALLGQAIEEPSAFEIIRPGEPHNDAQARELP
jgi:hypothetical protein